MTSDAIVERRAAQTSSPLPSAERSRSSSATWCERSKRTFQVFPPAPLPQTVPQTSLAVVMRGEEEEDAVVMRGEHRWPTTTHKRAPKLWIKMLTWRKCKHHRADALHKQIHFGGHNRVFNRKALTSTSGGAHCTLHRRKKDGASTTSST